MAIPCNGYTACPTCGIGCNYECSSETTEWGECVEVPRGELVVRPPLGGGGRFPRGLRPSLGGGRGRAHVVPTSSPNPHYDNRARKQRGMRDVARYGGAKNFFRLPKPTQEAVAKMGAWCLCDLIGCAEDYCCTDDCCVSCPWYDEAEPHVPPTSSPNPHYDNRARKQRGRRLRALKRRGWGGVPIPYPTNPHPRSIGAIGGGRGRGGQGFGRGLSQSNIKARYGLGFGG